MAEGGEGEDEIQFLRTVSEHTWCRRADAAQLVQVASLYTLRLRVVACARARRRMLRTCRRGVRRCEGGGGCGGGVFLTGARLRCTAVDTWCDSPQVARTRFYFSCAWKRYDGLYVGAVGMFRLVPPVAQVQREDLCHSLTREVPHASTAV